MKTLPSGLVHRHRDQHADGRGVGRDQPEEEDVASHVLPEDSGSFEVHELEAEIELFRRQLEGGEEDTRSVVRQHGRRHEDSRATRVKTLAMFLPQFHPIPENDDWWGAGFTEWANVTRAQPSFEGHEQPLLPADLGFYDLRIPEIRALQAELAREHGIHGFCYYYYWFHGKKLLERPIEEVIATGEPDFPFCLCWANENWTRRWDGEDQSILMAQEHTPESDARFIEAIMPALLDRRYIRCDGKPLLLVYRADQLADPAGTAAKWREAASRAGLPGLHLCAVWRVDDPRPLGFDAIVEFPPHHFEHVEITDQVKAFSEGFSGRVFDYEAGVRAVESLPDKPFPVYRGVMPTWDNSARRRSNATIFARSSPEVYREWLEQVAWESADRPGTGDQFVFINAWNEWAEGAMLEPSQTHGRAYLEATHAALDSLSKPQLRISRFEARVARRLRDLDMAFEQLNQKVEERDVALRGHLQPTLESQDAALSWLAGRVEEAKAAAESVRDSIPELLRLCRELQQRSALAEARQHASENATRHLASTLVPAIHGLRQSIADRQRDVRERLVQFQVRSDGLQRLALASMAEPPTRALWLGRHFGWAGLALKLPIWILSFRWRSRLGWWRQGRRILRSGLFDREYYLERYPEVTSSKGDPLYHYVRFGAAEGRDPNPFFSATRYLEEHPQARDQNPLLHYLATSHRAGKADRDLAGLAVENQTSLVEQAAALDAAVEEVLAWSAVSVDGGEIEGAELESDAPTATTQEGQAERISGPVQWALNERQLERRASASAPVLFVSHDAARAGAQIYLREVLESLAELPDYELFVLMRAGGELRGDFEELAHVLDVQDYIASRESEQAVVEEAIQAMERAPGVAVSNTVASSAVAKILCGMGVPVVSLVHELPTTIEALGEKTIHDTVSSSRRVVVVSEFVRDAIARRFEIATESLQVVYVGATGWHPENEDADAARQKIFERHSLPEDATLVLGCGSIHHRKGPDLFVQVARQAIQDHGLENTYFLWVGGDEQGPLVRSWCEHDIATSRLEDKVRFVGQQDSAVDYYLASDVFLLTSREDPFPLVNLEALARGLPVVAFDGAGGASEALRDDAGVVVPYLDVAEMARALFRLVEAPRHRAAIGGRALDRANERFRWERFIAELRELIDGHLGG